MAEMRKVTVLFVNLTGLGFQQSSGKIDLNEINKLFSSLQKIVVRYEGFLRQFLGPWNATWFYF